MARTSPVVLGPEEAGAQPTHFQSSKETRCGFAFEVPVKSPSGKNTMPTVRQRLESQARSPKHCNDIVENDTADGAEDNNAVQRTLLRREQVKERAERDNEQKKHAAESCRVFAAERLQQQSDEMTSRQESAAKKREQVMASRKAKAVKHVEEVKERREVCEQRRAEDSAARQLRFDEAARQKDAVHDASIVDIRNKAGKHLEEVKAKVESLACKEAEEAATRLRRLEEDVRQKDAAHASILADRRNKAAQHLEEVKARREEFEQKRLEDLAALQQKLDEDARQKDAMHDASIAGIRDKAGKHYEEARAKKEEFEQRQMESVAALQKRLDEDARLKGAFHDASLADKSSKAGKHFEDVMAKKEQNAKKEIEDMALRQQRMEEDARQKDASHDASLADNRTKAGKHFEEVKAKVDGLARKEAEETASRQQRLEEDARQKEASYGACLAERANKAGKHFEEVKAKVEDMARKEAEDLASRQQRLEDLARQKDALHDANLADRRTKAGRHCEQVKTKKEACEHRRAEDAATRQHRNDEDARQKGAVHDASIEDIRLKAGKHLEVVKARKEQLAKRDAEESAARQLRLDEEFRQKDAIHDASVARRGAFAGEHNRAVADKLQKWQSSAYSCEQLAAEESKAESSVQIETLEAENATDVQISIMVGTPKVDNAAALRTSWADWFVRRFGCPCSA